MHASSFYGALTHHSQNKRKLESTCKYIFQIFCLSIIGFIVSWKDKRKEKKKH